MNIIKTVDMEKNSRTADYFCRCVSGGLASFRTMDSAEPVFKFRRFLGLAASILLVALTLVFFDGSRPLGPGAGDKGGGAVHSMDNSQMRKFEHAQNQPSERDKSTVH